MDDIVEKLRSQIGDDVSQVYEKEALFRAAADEISLLRAACAKWAEVSQRNYQRAKAAEAALGITRMCVACGKVRSAEDGREAPVERCHAPDACTWDMTPQEAADHWRKLAHDRAGRIAELEAGNARLRGLLQECADDLRSYVDTEYPETMRAQYPSMQRRWTRDMELVFRVRAALAADSGAADE